MKQEKESGVRSQKTEQRKKTKEGVAGIANSRSEEPTCHSVDAVP